MNLYIGNLPFTITEADIKTTFEAFGEVESINLITDKYTGQSKGFGFIEMPQNSAADAAIKALNGSSMGGRDITVNQAKPRESRPSRGRRH